MLATNKFELIFALSVDDVAILFVAVRCRSSATRERHSDRSSVSIHRVIAVVVRCSLCTYFVLRVSSRSIDLGSVGPNIRSHTQQKQEYTYLSSRSMGENRFLRHFDDLLVVYRLKAATAAARVLKAHQFDDADLGANRATASLLSASFASSE